VSENDPDPVAPQPAADAPASETQPVAPPAAG
jgi:hypothetical protein